MRRGPLNVAAGVLRVVAFSIRAVVGERLVGFDDPSRPGTPP